MGALIEAQVTDAYAYIATLDAPEALGEIIHMAPLLNLATEEGVPPGPIDRLIAILFAGLVQQAVTRGTEVRPPTHGDGLHLCTLVGRLLEAVAQESRS